MSAGTLTLTNNSAAVTGSGTAFTTELAVGDFIVVTVGGIPYTLAIKTVNSNTSLTLVSNYTGPTQGGAAWYAVPRVAMNLVTAALVAQSAEALRGLNYDKQNWQRLFSASGNITVTLPDGSSFTGPSWQYMVNTVATKTNGAVPVNQGGTGATNASDARANLGAAKSGTNDDLTLIRGLTGRAQLWGDTDYSTGTLVSYTGTTVGAIVRATTSIVATSTYAASASFGYWIDANSIGSSGPALASTGSQQNRWIFRNSSGAISTANGDITPSASDERVKNIIREITEEEAVDFISGLKPIRYTFKWAPEKVKVGYSAQNVEALDSELISVSALTVIDPESSESTTYEDGKIIDPGEVGAAYLVPVVKQLLRRVSELEEKLNLKSAQS
ncbi:tail fiber domain-containing protein [Enterobacter hormaechei]|uniref:tail fiber domain-containing protein n=1 Tax=Enterobacter hormaechei TaxID=158836 RepID=UPI002AA5E199|nr:tail fiber domain-containing protein [Enterobacter hormaechei]MDY7152107.1 tail fiber domain-containing protein [Enterobacter hormaechei]